MYLCISLSVNLSIYLSMYLSVYSAYSCLSTFFTLYPFHLSIAQEMMELFTLVTEFSRHFYAMLNREGVGAPLPNTSSAEKVIKIVGRLTEYGESLTRKKNNLLVQERETSGISDLFLHCRTLSCCLFACLFACLLACLLKSVFVC